MDRFSYSITSNPYTNYIAFCVEKGNLYLSHVLEDDFLGKDLDIWLLVITPKMSNLKTLEIFACHKGRFSENYLQVQKTGRTGPG